MVRGGPNVSRYPFSSLLAAMACSNDFVGDGEDQRRTQVPPVEEEQDEPAEEEVEEEIDETLTDDDGDGLSEEEGDCDDTDAAVHPEAEEVPYDGLDNDCDEATLDDDLDGDGHLAEDDCDDSASDIYPGASEDYTDGIDNDCDDVVDERFEAEIIEDNVYGTIQCHGCGLSRTSSCDLHR